MHNTVLGHDNCEHGSFSSDSTFVYIDHGAMHLGDFNGTALNYSLVNSLELRVQVGVTWSGWLGLQDMEVTQDKTCYAK